MLPQEFIRTKRDGGTLAPEDMARFIRGLTDGSVTEGQAAAFAMAVFFRGLDRDETVALTLAMRDSGTVLDWTGLDLPGPVVDKHSTGGVGDNVSLMLAPMLAAAGACVPMISGRGLGHTGGTLDKLDSVPGYDTAPGLGLFRKTVIEAGCAIIGQTDDLAPADRRLYGVRDVTATVESIPLITASILSKKLAAGLRALVLDVKTGTGAFMSTAEAATDLARNLVAVANGAGLPTTALVTDMNAPLAPVAGNAVEVRQAVNFLTGRDATPRLREVNLRLGAELMVTAGLAETSEDAVPRLESVLDSGAAAERFARMVRCLGGPADILEKSDDLLPLAPLSVPVTVPQDAIVRGVDTRALGLAVIELGGGRRRAADRIDHSVGLSGLAGPGDEAGPDRPLALVHARDRADADRAVALISAAYEVGSEPPEVLPVIHARIAGPDT